MTETTKKLKAEAFASLTKYQNALMAEIADTAKEARRILNPLVETGIAKEEHVCIEGTAPPTNEYWAEIPDWALKHTLEAVDSFITNASNNTLSPTAHFAPELLIDAYFPILQNLEDLLDEWYNFHSLITIDILK